MKHTSSAICLAMTLAGPSNAQPALWDGDAGDGYWVTDSNWDPDSVPGPSSFVTIPGDAGQVTIELSAESCATLDCLSSLRLNAGSIDVSGNANVTNLVMEGGGFIPTIFADGQFMISGNSSCVSGEIFGDGAFENTGNFDAFFFGFTSINGTNSGNWNLYTSSANITLSGGATLTNSGSLSLVNDTSITGESGELINTGSITRTGGMGFASIETKLTMTGGTIIASGTGANLSIEGPGWSVGSGTLSVSGGAYMSFSGSNSSGTRSMGAATISGNGTVEIFPQNTTINWPGTSSLNVSDGGTSLRIGTINLTGSISNSGLLELRGTIISGSGSLTNTSSGTMRIPTSNAGDLRLNASNLGTLEIPGTLYISDGAVLTNSGPNAQTKLIVGSSISTQTAGNRGRFSNAATLKLDAKDSTVVGIDTSYDAQKGSVLECVNGTLALRAGGTLAGGYMQLRALQRPAAILIEGDQDTTYENTGTVRLHNTNTASLTAKIVIGTNSGTGPVINSASSDAKLINEIDVTTEMRSGRLTGVGSVLNEGQFEWIGGSIESTLDNNKDLIIPAGFSRTLSGSILNSDPFDQVFQSGTFSMDNATINNGKGALWKLFDGGSILVTGTGGTLHNAGTISVDDMNDGAHLIAADLNNTGVVHAIQGDLSLTGSVLQLNELDGTLSGGTWVASELGSISFPRSLVRLNGPGKIVGGTDQFPDMASLSSMGMQASAELTDAMFTGDMSIDDESSITISGEMHINGEYRSSGGSTTILEQGANIESTGDICIGEVDSAADDLNTIAVIARRGATSSSIITPTLELYGGLRVGQSGSSAIGLQGDLLMHPNARLHIKLLPGSTDQLVVDGAATLAGRLVLDASETSHVLGETLTVLSASEGIDGNIDEVIVEGLASGQTYIAGIVGNELRITATNACPGDLNGDGDLNFFDVSAFLSAYNAQDPVADFTMDGLFNFFDVSAFLSAYSSGCP